MSGIDIKRFVDLNENLKIEELSKQIICSICLNIFNNAVNSECRHSFCRQCIEQWINADHNDCPKCKRLLTRKRSLDTTDSDHNHYILIGNYVFGHDFTANGIISELKIKCNFEYNGCQEVIEFGRLDAHLKQCEHRICKTCELDAGMSGPHNCIQILKNQIKAINEKSEQTMNGLKAQLQKEIQKKEALDKSLKLKDSLTLSDNYLIVGNYRNSFGTFIATDIGIKVSFMRSNKLNAKFPVRMIVPFNEMEEFLYCSDPTFPVLCVKPVTNSCLKIQEGLYLGDNSPNRYKFDVNNQNERYIIVVLKETEENSQLVSNAVDCCKKSVSNIKCEEIDLLFSKQIIKRIIRI